MQVVQALAMRLRFLRERESGMITISASRLQRIMYRLGNRHFAQGCTTGWNWCQCDFAGALRELHDLIERDRRRTRKKRARTLRLTYKRREIAKTSVNTGFLGPRFWATY
jgi:transcriptional regulator with GAF, ATPase, and Fis domain